ncbi:MAG TPA: response regulator [Acidimicrobiales bacterium]|nr:response regulator [Acidimicrobiales bacterium]
METVVLVVDDSETARRLVRLGLELEGVTVVEADTLARARRLLDTRVQGVVLDRELPDGEGLDLLPDVAMATGGAAVVVHSSLEDGREPGWVARVDKGDVPGIIAALGLNASPDDRSHLAVVDLVREEVEPVVDRWHQLCRWDPSLPPDAVPPAACTVVEAVAEALQRPQPLGWGLDPALHQVVEVFARTVGATDVAIGQLVCLREAFRRHLAGQLPPDEETESRARLDMIIDRAICSTARLAASPAVAVPVEIVEAGGPAGEIERAPRPGLAGRPTV